MSRLQAELHRLYLPHAAAGQDTDAEVSALIDAQGQVRAMVLELARPADWELISKVWKGVQLDLDLPAPGIAVSGRDGYQLWFSLAKPLPVPQATAFLDGLRQRYLRDVAPERVGLMPAVDALAPALALHALMVPALQAQAGQWSAFVAPDLAPVFAETPWLDIPPSFDGQADLLARLDSIQSDDFQRALERLRPTVASSGSASPEMTGSTADKEDTGVVLGGTYLNPKRFLLDVMNNDTVALGLRIDAAKALLPYFDAPDDDAA